MSQFHSKRMARSLIVSFDDLSALTKRVDRSTSLDVTLPSGINLRSRNGRRAMRWLSDSCCNRCLANAFLYTIPEGLGSLVRLDGMRSDVSHGVSGAIFSTYHHAIPGFDAQI